MNTATLHAKYLPQIQSICPDLPITTVSINSEGLVNDVAIVNDNTAFRFAKDAYGQRVLAIEVRLLELIHPHVTLAIPQPFYTGPAAIAYALLPGEALLRTRLDALDEQAKQRVADQLATFLRQLHAIPYDATVPATLAPCRYDDWIGIRRRVEERIYPLLMKHQRVWLETLFNTMLDDPSNFAYAPRLIHGDLGCYHLLLDVASSSLTGVIDFGVAGIGDPAVDFACLLQYYGASLIQRLYAEYPEARQYAKRAQFYAQAIELQWVLSGLESGESFWFTAHLGNARDL